MAKTGILLLNIGSPRSYQLADVKKYLKTFLMDEDIINIPFPIRWFLVHGIIVPRRSPYSAENYKKIWMEGKGSPLTVYTESFAAKLGLSLGGDFEVKIGMRYSDPSIEKALNDFSKEKIKKIILVPLYPQYANATTGSSIKEVQRIIQQKNYNFEIETLKPFFAADEFVTPSANLIAQHLKDKEVDHYLFSFHGLPESQVKKVSGCLTNPDCCSQVNACEKNCYRAQCFASAKGIANKLQLSPESWSVSFQSRLGRGEWIKPATDSMIESLASKGFKRIAVACPSFVADCIETLEEIGIGGNEQFHHAGGKEFHLIPCLNDSDDWIQSFSKMISTNFKTSKTR